MTTPDAHERFAELAVGHALHALEPEDEQVFLAHLASCAACQHAVDAHTDTLGHLAYAAEPAELPAGILAGIRREVGPPAAAPPAVPAPVSLDAARARRRLPVVQGKGLVSAVAAVAAVALVLSLGIWNVALHRDRSASEQRSQNLAAAVQTLEGGAKHRVQLTDAKGLPVGVAVVHSDDTVSLVVDGLAPNDRAHSTYVLWQRGSYGVVRAVGAFDVRGEGVDVVEHMKLARDVVGIDGFAVTREAGRTAPAAPKGQAVANGGLSA